MAMLRSEISPLNHTPWNCDAHMQGKKEGKWWNFDKLYLKKTCWSARWRAPASLAVTLLSGERVIYFYFLSITHFLMWCDVFYSFVLVAEISSRFIHPENIYSEWQNQNVFFKMYSSHIVLNWRRDLLVGTLGICLAFTSQQLSKWQWVLTQLSETFGRCFWVCVAHGPVYSRQARGLAWFHFQGLSCFFCLLNMDNLVLPVGPSAF